MREGRWAIDVDHTGSDGVRGGSGKYKVWYLSGADCYVAGMDCNCDGFVGAVSANVVNTSGVWVGSDPGDRLSAANRAQQLEHCQGKSPGIL